MERGDLDIRTSLLPLLKLRYLDLKKYIFDLAPFCTRAIKLNKIMEVP